MVGYVVAMSELDVEVMRAAVARDVNRVYTEGELFDALCAYGSCRACGATRVSKMMEPELRTFLLSMVCSANEEHEC